MASGRPASFYLSHSVGRAKRTLTLDLNDSAYQGVFEYAQAVCPDRPVQEAIRDLLLQALGSNPEGGAIRAARIQAYREIRDRMYRDLGVFLKSLSVQVDQEANCSESHSLIGNYAPSNAA
ncbi:MAG TPA: hypothetical protein VLY82_02745 [Nitrososphaerales archaeon]|nr:hypothetical protein [Nitrososphaerales archaeon]